MNAKEIVELWNNNILFFLKKSFLIYKSPFVEGYLIFFQGRKFFLKIFCSSFLKKREKIFSAEYRNIKILKQVSKFESIRIVAYQDPDKEYKGFILSYWEDLFIANEESFFREAAEKLANMHSKLSNYYGYERTNYYSGFVQKNKKSYDWIEFFYKNRMMPLLKILMRRGMWNLKFEKIWDRFFIKLKNFLNAKEKASLVHGDFWIKNIYATKHGKPFLIDPSLHYASREWDIASAMYWGGFPKSFFSFYKCFYPLDKGFEERIQIYQLYYELVSLIIFKNWDESEKKILKTLQQFI